jgi:predicted Zn-dependent peptidase
VRNVVADIQGVTSQDIQTAAQRYLVDGRAFRFVVRAKPN